jgi:four helix bundle protein
MKQNNIITDKSFKFAKRIYFLYKFLTETKKEYILSKQILRSGTSIGANIEEALGGQSSKDFLSKISISYKEARETLYWLKLLFEVDILDEKQFTSLKEDCDEILKILGSIQKTMKSKNEK